MSDHERAEKNRRIQYANARNLIIDRPEYVDKISKRRHLEYYIRTLQVQPYFTNLPKS